MGLFDMFKVGAYKQEIETLKSEVNMLKDENDSLKSGNNVLWTTVGSGTINYI